VLNAEKYIFAAWPQEGHPACKTLRQNPLLKSGGATTGEPSFTWEMSIEKIYVNLIKARVCVCLCVCVAIVLESLC